jgi:glycosyltransferase involved in cell wall biosynthesis
MMTQFHEGPSEVKNPDSREGQHVALLMANLEGGGVQRIMLHLARALADRGHRVDLLVYKAQGDFVDSVPSGIRVVALETAPGWMGRLHAFRAAPEHLIQLALPVLLPLKSQGALRCLPALVRYLREERPAVLLSAEPDLNLVALWARRLAGVYVRTVISEHIHLPSHLRYGAKRRKWRWRFIVPLIRRTYPEADRIIAVSRGVADDLRTLAGLPPELVTTVYNPVVDSELAKKAEAPVDHAWFKPGAPPVIIAVGRLTEQKDFSTLLQAFAQVRAQRQARLLILGEGELRRKLEALARELGVDQDVSLPGFASNPFAYMARAAVFVLSSAYEGLPGVLIEALACGCPVVSTDCPSGPAEILENGQYGRLVPVGDQAAMAQAILSTLEAPPDRGLLQKRASLFSVDRAVEQYLEVLLDNRLQVRIRTIEPW